MKLRHRFWRDQRGYVGVVGALLLCLIVSLGAIVGLACLRNKIVCEFADLSAALRHLNQSFSFTVGGVTHQYVDSDATVDAPPPIGSDLTLTAPAEPYAKGEQ